MTISDSDAARTLEASVSIDVPAHQIWALLIDPATMSAASPELFAMTRRRKGPFVAGEKFVGWNRRGAVVWPTSNTVTTVKPLRELAWVTHTSGAVWTYTLTEHDGSTTLTERRTVPDGVPRFAALFAAIFLGGLGRHSADLEADLSRTLAWFEKEL